MRDLKLSTARNLTVFMTDSADHITGKASLTLTITASKDGAAFGSISPTVTDLGSGWYGLALTTTHTNTLGDLAIHITGAGADPTDILCQVVTDLQGASVSSVTGNVGGNVVGSVASVTGLTASDVGAIKAKTDNLPASPAAVGSAMTLTSGERTSIAAAIWNALTSGLTTVSSIGKLLVTNIDAAISSASTLGAIRKNIAIPGFQFKMYDTSGNPALDLTGISAKVSLDGGAFADCVNVSTIAEIGNGWYKIDLDAADTNGKTMALKFTVLGAAPNEFTSVTET